MRFSAATTKIFSGDRSNDFVKVTRLFWATEPGMTY
jgi:hypothetical protein